MVFWLVFAHGHESLDFQPNFLLAGKIFNQEQFLHIRPKIMNHDSIFCTFCFRGQKKQTALRLTGYPASTWPPSDSSVGYSRLPLSLSSGFAYEPSIRLRIWNSNSRFLGSILVLPASRGLGLYGLHKYEIPEVVGWKRFASFWNSVGISESHWQSIQILYIS
jgi:hypothetical protein